MRRKLWISLGAVAVVLLLGAVLFRDHFLPEKTTRLREAENMSDELLAQGTFDGRAGHSASGTVKLLRNATGAYLRFEDFEMTSGPSVFLYVTPSMDPDSTDEVRAGRRILIEGGADGGELTKRGTYHQPLPADIDLTTIHGVGAWCEEFHVPFASAELGAP